MKFYLHSLLILSAFFGTGMSSFSALELISYFVMILMLVADDFDDYLLLTPADRLTRKPKKTCPGALVWRLYCTYVTQKINLSII
jgi:hypothetical protein